MSMDLQFSFAWVSFDASCGVSTDDGLCQGVTGDPSPSWCGGRTKSSARDVCGVIGEM